MSNLLHFLTDFATDTRKQRTFALTPNAVIDTAELSEADKTALKSRDLSQISLCLTSELSPMAVTMLEPNPDPLPDPDPIPLPPPPPPEESPPT